MPGRSWAGRLRRLVAFLDWLTTYDGSYWVLGAVVALLLVWLVPFQLTGQPEETVETIAWTWWPFQLAYAAAGSSIAVCTWRRVVRDVRRAARGPRIAAAPPAGARVAAGLSLSEARSGLESRGMLVLGETAGALSATRQRMAPLGGSFFHAGILLVALAFMAHLATAEEISFRVIEGQGFPEAMAASGVDPSASGMEVLDAYTLDGVWPDYYEDYLLFTRLEADIELADGTVRTASLSDPLWLDPLTLLSIQDYGFAPGLRVESLSTGHVADSVVAMQVFPPGAEDSVDFPEAGLRVVARLYPDHGVVDGRDVSLSYHAYDPRLLLTLVHPGGSPEFLGRGLVGVGDAVSGGDLSVTVIGLYTYGVFRVTRSWGVPLFVLAALSMVAGVAIRVFMRRLDVVVWETDEGVAFDARMDSSDREEARRVAGRLLGLADEQ